MVFYPGLVIGKYELRAKLGEGGFGFVFVARDTGLDRDVAMKFLHPHHTSNAQILQRFLQEARVAAKIVHPGIVTIHECGQVSGTNSAADGTAYIAMELLHGESLHARIAHRRMAPADAFEICRQIASAVEAAHRAGIIHRDLKPDNVYLVADPAMPNGERVKVLDFGIAKLAQAPANSMQTASMMVFGTPLYMSPEQCRSAAQVDHRSDIYTLGCILFQLLTGRPPFAGEFGELIAKHQMVPPPSLRSIIPNIPEHIDRLLSEMLEKDPAKRPQTMAAVQRACSMDRPSGIAPAVQPDESQQRMTPYPGNAPTRATPSSGYPVQHPSSQYPPQSSQYPAQSPAAYPAPSAAYPAQSAPYPAQVPTPYPVRATPNPAQSQSRSTPYPEQGRSTPFPERPPSSPTTLSSATGSRQIPKKSNALVVVAGIGTLGVAGGLVAFLLVRGGGGSTKTVDATIATAPADAPGLVAAPIDGAVEVAPDVPIDAAVAAGPIDAGARTVKGVVLTPEAITQRVNASYGGALRRCYEKSLKVSGNTAGGKLVVSLIVNAGRATGGATGFPQVHDCVRNLIPTWTFPVPTDGKPVTANVTIAFAPTVPTGPTGPIGPTGPGSAKPCTPIRKDGVVDPFETNPCSK